MSLSKKDLEHGLTTKLRCTKSESHHHLFHLTIGGRKVAQFRTSHSKGKMKELDDSGIGNMLRPFPNLSVRFFKDFINCDHTREEVLVLLRL